MHYVAGPHDGVYVAAYTIRTDEGIFAFTKTCAERPRHVWDETPGHWRFSNGPYLEEASALLIAVDLAFSTQPAN